MWGNPHPGFKTIAYKLVISLWPNHLKCRGLSQGSHPCCSSPQLSDGHAKKSYFLSICLPFKPWYQLPWTVQLPYRNQQEVRQERNCLATNPALYYNNVHHPTLGFRVLKRQTSSLRKAAQLKAYFFLHVQGIGRILSWNTLQLATKIQRPYTPGYNHTHDPPHSLNWAEQTIIFHLRIGHCGLGACLKRVDIKEYAKCDYGTEYCHTRACSQEIPLQCPTEKPDMVCLDGCWHKDLGPVCRKTAMSILSPPFIEASHKDGRMIWSHGREGLWNYSHSLTVSLPCMVFSSLWDFGRRLLVVLQLVIVANIITSQIAIRIVAHSGQNVAF